MILTSHSIIGVAAARLAPVNPILAFSLAFLSHFVADAIPHWEYKLSKISDPKYSEKISLNKDFAIDVMKVGSDILFGVLLSYFIFYGENPELILIGILGGIFPDILQFLYGKIKIEPLITFKKIHDAVHSERMEDRMFFGIATQVITILFITFLSYIFVN
ncbi:MAG: hypothetical protein UT05_C0010G0004 [Parcubacteria group bacterium GW2011_GWF2_38_76]|nr:MAG: hypothetical protein UT05_C0010G0004 [Parcubacteria group bacterium GW2011_GWF2_38_76]HBM45566.1 hypothetical protein [Patescibacteria group bacterium]